MADVTVVIPTIPTRGAMLRLAIESAASQTVECDVLVQGDVDYEQHGYRVGGAARTRNRALALVETEWTAFLDDDDTLYPYHVEECLATAAAADADLVYPWFDGANSTGVLHVPRNGSWVTPEGVPFDGELRSFLLNEPKWELGRDQTNFIPITVLVRTELLQGVGGIPVPGTDEWPFPMCEDHGLWIRLLEAGAVFAHCPRRTWHYGVHTGEQSGKVLA